MSKEIVSKAAYLIGVKDIHFNQFNESIISTLKKSSDCNLIRRLCQFRTTLLLHYNEIERDLKRKYGRISDTDRCRELYDSLLSKHGLDFELYNYNVKDYITRVNDEIENRIDSVRLIFLPSAQNEWPYIRDLFIFPMKNYENERKKFINSKEIYPFMCYINWDPHKAGNILENDSKFMSILYFNKGKEYAVSKESMMNSLYNYSQNCNRLVICVDCENVDYISFYTAITQLRSEILNKIEKVLLFNDSNLKLGWNFYSIDLPVEFERIECPRIQDNKSTLDVKMASCITALHYRDGIDGFILATSDSDYWGLIDSISSTAKFFILGEKDKISEKNISALDRNRIPYCMLDDFNSEEIRNKIKEDTYKEQIAALLSKKLPSIESYLDLIHNQSMYIIELDKPLFNQIACKLNISFDKDGKAIYYF